jgi:predicted transposase YdaD
LRDERRYSVAENHPGIYTIGGDILPIQVIDSRRLPADENLWLKSLSNRLDTIAFSRINEEVARQDKEAQIAAYLDVIVRANTKTVKEIVKMGEMPVELEQVLEETGWLARWEARGRAEGESRGRTEGALAIAQNLVNLGLPLETVVSATQLKPEQVQGMYQLAVNS